jgi:UDP-N-acetylglucosamine--N-acetylmuramyl-(pentapeptide) pyrophosphoryl-undecaprenol N-acetylglucosamine transferase
MTHMQEKEKECIALTGGSTWGHVFPLLATYNYLQEEKQYDFIWVWEEWWLEEEIARKNRIPFLDIPAWKIRRYFDIKNFYEPLKNITWIFFGIYFILKYKIDIVFSKWGYVAIPLCIAAFILRKKIYIHESDTVSWVANKIIWKIATKVFYTFPNEIKNKKAIVTWQILNPELIDWLTDLNIIQNPKLNIIVIAWSQWSTTIFEALLKLLPDFWDINFQIVLWEKNMHLRNKFKQFPNVLAHDFLTQKRLWIILKNSDIAITRGWATTLWELNMFWIHSIIIPLSNSAWNHQNKNADYFHEKFWSDVLDENNQLEVNLFRKIQSYKDLRKSWLNLDWFFKPLQIIESEIK